ncbi:MAG: ATP-binding protein [Thermomicrobiales bacterium]
MNEADLLQLVAGGESEALEFKASTAELDSGLQSVCGVLNTGSPGFVFFGITDGGDVRGQEVGDQTLERVANGVRRIEPMTDISIDTVSLENGRAVVIVACPASVRTHTFGGVPYQRLGKTTSRMPSDLYRQRIIDEAHRSDSWESRPAAGFTLADLDHRQIVMTVEEAIRRQRLSDPLTRDIEPLLLGLGLLKDGRILNAAMVLFGKEDRLRVSYPQCLLRLARFRGTTKSEFLDNRQFVGNAFDVFARAQQFWIDHLPVAGRIVPNLIERIDEPLYPTAALREAMANAICHRDYAAIGGGIDLAIYDDRLEITSTGPLRFGIAIDDLLAPHQSRSWNPGIAHVFYRQGIIESWGSGTLRMIELNQSAGLAPPEFVASPHSFTVRFRPTASRAPSRVDTDLSPLQQAILNTLAEHGPIPLRELMDLLPDEPALRTVQDNLQILKMLGLVYNAGKARASRWLLTGTVPG